MPHRSILVVEDDESLRGAIVALLEGEGYSVIGNGELADQLKQAVDRLPEFAPIKACCSAVVLHG